MMQKSYTAILALGLSLLSGCGQNGKTNSKLDGHYENSSAALFKQSTGAQRATAEYEPSRGVIISLPLISSFGMNQMAAAIADADIEKLWIIVPSTFTGTFESSSTFSGLRSLIGRNASKVELVKQQTAGSLTVWARDWSPQGALTADGSLRLLDFNYYGNRQADDFTAQSMERLLDFDRVSVPVYNEGGNFMNNTRGDCLMTTRVTDANEVAERSDDIELDADGVAAYYKAAAGCKTVKIFPRIPYEGTGHIDMWAKFLDDDNVIVSELREEVMGLYTTKADLQKARNMQAYLEARAVEIKAMGFNVIRIPAPGPIFRNEETYRSYTNSLTVSGSVIVPRYVAPDSDTIATANGNYFDQALLPKYEAEVRKVYESFGYKFTWVNSDALIFTGGAVHCTTMQIPL
jgi:agmatine/peptidylarginine deiminase